MVKSTDTGRMPEGSKRRRVPFEVKGGVTDFEHDGDPRENARSLGFEDLPGSGEDTMSDLNLGSRAGSVDSIGGNDSVSSAEELTEYDNITDSNTLTSAATIGGVHAATGAPRARDHARLSKGPEAEPKDRRSERYDDADRDVGTLEGLEVDRLRATFETDTVVEVGDEGFSGLGLRDVPDDETVRGYTESSEVSSDDGARARSREALRTQGCDPVGRRARKRKAKGGTEGSGRILH